MSSKYKIVDHTSPHFITFATVQWINALSRPYYKDIVIESLQFCQKKKGLTLYAYVIMSNHIHLIASAIDRHNLSDIIRDLKRHTSKKILHTIESNPQESRKNWMLWLFKSAGQKNPNNKTHQFWQQDNRPVELSTNEMIEQRLAYLHNNPVKEGLVYAAEDYVYSSASNYASKESLLKVEFL